MYKKIFLDSDVILDFIADRQPFVYEAEQVFNLIDKSQVQAFCSSVIISNIYYLLATTFKLKNARTVIKTLVKRIKVLSISENHVNQALDYTNIKDFEDALQVFSALEAQIDCLVTRNKKDFKNDLGLRILSPDEFLAINKASDL